MPTKTGPKYEMIEATFVTQLRALEWAAIACRQGHRRARVTWDDKLRRWRVSFTPRDSFPGSPRVE